MAINTVLPSEFRPVQTWEPIPTRFEAAHVERPGTYTILGKEVAVHCMSDDPSETIDLYVTIEDDRVVTHKGPEFRAKYQRSPGVR